MKNTRIKLYASIGLALFFALAGAAWAADCGGDEPCSCGDNVVEDRTLVADEDLVLGTACAGDGLIMNTEGVTLDLGGKRITGKGNGAGVKIEVDGVTIRNGKIEKFARGISTNSSATNDSLIEKIKTRLNTQGGIKINGDFNILEKNSAMENDGHGIRLDGHDNELIKNTADKNEFDGIHVDGTGNTLEKNSAKKNNGDGISVEGGGNIDDGGNKGKKNVGDDCLIDLLPCV